MTVVVVVVVAVAQPESKDTNLYSIIHVQRYHEDSGS